MALTAVKRYTWMQDIVLAVLPEQKHTGAWLSKCKLQQSPRTVSGSMLIKTFSCKSSFQSFQKGSLSGQGNPRDSSKSQAGLLKCAYPTSCIQGQVQATIHMQLKTFYFHQQKRTELAVRQQACQSQISLSAVPSKYSRLKLADSEHRTFFHAVKTTICSMSYK